MQEYMILNDNSKFTLSKILSLLFNTMKVFWGIPSLHRHESFVNLSQ